MKAALVTLSVFINACGSHTQVAADAVGTGIDSAPPSCPTPVTEDTADHSTTPQMIASPSSVSGTTILVLGTPDGNGGYASLNGYFEITGLPASKAMNISLVMGTACTPACSTKVEMRAGYHPNIVLLGDNLAMGCNGSGSTATTTLGELQLLALSTNNGPDYAYLIQIP
ncbi:MAG: hypothetical protein JWO36_337 [Myxococcales bacterium]|nr:hypothetical protein [Myxococcales bacterium]